MVTIWHSQFPNRNSPEQYRFVHYLTISTINGICAAYDLKGFAVGIRSARIDKPALTDTIPR